MSAARPCSTDCCTTFCPATAPTENRSNNPGKAREVEAILAPLGIEVLPIRARAPGFDVVEDGDTFAANAEKKALAAERKAAREENKERYGWATIDGVRMEIGNYTVEPSSIFMGRGQHPFRGKWKEGPRHEDVELNLSPDADVPPA